MNILSKVLYLNFISMYGYLFIKTTYSTFMTMEQHVKHSSFITVLVLNKTLSNWCTINKSLKFFSDALIVYSILVLFK